MFTQQAALADINPGDSLGVTSRKAAYGVLTACEGGSQKIIVPAEASISTLVPGERSHFVPGAAMNLPAAPGADGNLVAQRIQVSPRK